MRISTVHKIAVSAALVAVLLAAFVIFLPPGGHGGSGAVTVRVAQGQSVSDIGRSLKREGLIRSTKAFDFLIRLSGASKKIQAGTYKIAPSSSLLSVVKKFANGEVYKIVVTIPEGYTSRMVAGLLEKYGVCSSADFLGRVRDPAFAKSLGIDGPSLEGFLYPDTYYFQELESPDTVAKVMVSQFKKKIESISPKAFEDFASLYKKVILASIVEREYRVPAEAPLIASVFLNRLKIGMALQSCATVVYVMTEEYGMPHPEIVYYSNLALKSRYNTYLHPGLPPGPICNPGETSLRAVFNPEKSEYLYFRLADPNSGTHIFSKTFQEHSLAATRVKGI